MNVAAGKRARSAYLTEPRFYEDSEIWLVSNKSLKDKDEVIYIGLNSLLHFNLNKQLQWLLNSFYLL